MSARTASSLTQAARGTSAAVSMPPVMVLKQYVKWVKGQSYGTMIDHCSTDHYVTLDLVKKYKFPGAAVELLVVGIGGETSRVDTKLYKVPIKALFMSWIAMVYLSLPLQLSRQINNDMMHSAQSLELNLVRLGDLVEWICYYR